jgi:hypothetical protein
VLAAAQGDASPLHGAGRVRPSNPLSRGEGSAHAHADIAEDELGGSVKMLIDAAFGVLVVMFAVLGWWLLEHVAVIPQEVDAVRPPGQREAN